MAGRRFRTTAVALALALGATACGGSDDDATEAVTEEEAAGGITDVTVEAEGEPQAGGSLVYGVEAETDGWNPATANWAISGHLIGMTIFDPLAAYDADGVAQPYLAESFAADDSGTVWTIGVRDGVQFHDGSPCDAAAIAGALEAYRSSILTGGALEPIEEITVVDPSTIEVTMSTPWFSFPATLTTQVGYVAAPAQLTAEGEASVNQPIGTGPYVFDSWSPDDELVVTKNDDYWREGLPYLDQITFRPISDPTSRLNGLLAGDLDVVHVESARTVADLQVAADDGDIQLIVDPAEQEEVFLMPNQGAAPFDDVRARLAVAHAVDRQEQLDAFGAGVARLASGPFVPESPWFVETEVPAFDPEKAKALVEEYEAEKGPLAITVSATSDPASRAIVEAVIEDLAVVGIDAEAEYTDQTTQIGDVLAGEYDLAHWRQFAAPDPDADYLWWHTGSGQGLDLNLARIDNPELDEALDAGRGTSDPAARREAYRRVQEEMNENAHYIWLQHTTWAIGTTLRVRDIANGPLPDGDPSLPFGSQVSGVHRLSQTWIEQ